MLTLLLYATLADTPAPPPPPPAPKCENADMHMTRPAGAPSIRPLALEPLAREEKSVVYSEGTCVKPIVVREQVGR